MKLNNVLLPKGSSTETFDIEYSNGQIQSIQPHHRSRSNGEAPPSLILPTLCHPHIHLDKAYLLTSNSTSQVQQHSGHHDAADQHPDYSDLNLQSGSFSEALQNTSKAKARYTIPDLVLRGSQLIAESIAYGVTSMRAFVEIDHVTQHKTIEAALQLKRQWAHLCHVQICVFAQDPVFSGEHGEENRRLMEEVLEKYGREEEKRIEVFGSTPYVEESYETGIENVKWAIEKALQYDLHLDFHLDYNLDGRQQPMVFDVVRLLNASKWGSAATTPVIGTKKIVLGHCTRMTILDDAQMEQLSRLIKARSLPISFVGLPTSDIFMMGRPGESDACQGQRQRGTLQVVDLIQRWGLEACVGVNNVGNAFTPWGNADPLRLASLGVGLYHAGTVAHANLLYECVSTRARWAIGLEAAARTTPGQRETNDFELSAFCSDGLLVVENETSFSVAEQTLMLPARQRLTVKDVVWDPPESRLRKTILRK